MKLRFITDFARNWKAGEVVEAKVLSNGDTLIDNVASVDTALLKEHCEVVTEVEPQESEVEKMTREEAIEYVNAQLDKAVDDVDFMDDEMYEALQTLVKIAEQEPTTQNNLGVDCIDRQAAITFVCNNTKEILKDIMPLEVKLSDDYLYENVAKIMRNPKVLPSVTPQEPCDNAVNRVEVKKIAKEMYLEVANMELDVKTISDCVSYTASKCREVLERKLQALSSVTPTRKTEREPILDKIKAEIENIDTNYYKSVNGIDMTECAVDFKDWILDILDKYRESEV